MFHWVILLKPAAYLHFIETSFKKEVGTCANLKITGFLFIYRCDLYIVLCSVVKLSLNDKVLQISIQALVY